jgi:hypothetical protein
MAGSISRGMPISRRSGSTTEFLLTPELKSESATAPFMVSGCTPGLR